MKFTFSKKKKIVLSVVKSKMFSVVLTTCSAWSFRFYFIHTLILCNLKIGNLKIYRYTFKLKNKLSLGKHCRRKILSAESCYIPRVIWYPPPLSLVPPCSSLFVGVGEMGNLLTYWNISVSLFSPTMPSYKYTVTR